MEGQSSNEEERNLLHTSNNTLSKGEELAFNICNHLEKMSARFSKLQEIDLTLDDPAGDEANRVDTESAGEGGTVELNLVEDPVFVPKWKFWNKPYKFRYDLAAG